MIYFLKLMEKMRLFFIILPFFFLLNQYLYAGTSGFQEYLIPGQESLLRTNYAYIDNDPVVGNNMHCVISATASTDGTIINYDHWENGYGSPDEVITLNTGQSHIFESGNIPANPRGTNTFYDGGDRILVIGGPAFVTRASWPESPGTVMASAFEILPIQAMSNTFEMPVGNDLYQSDRTKPFADFQSVILMIQSTTDNNVITVYRPNNTVLWTGTVNKGQSVTDASLRSIQKGTRVEATYPVQIQFLNGYQVNGTGSQINGFTGVPATLWGRKYSAAATSFQASSGSENSRTDLYLYNPNAQSITVSFQDSISGTFSIASKELASFAAKTGHYLPRQYGASLTGTDTFWGFGIGGSGYDTWDWGFILMPNEYCRKEYVVGWAPGDLNKTNNYSAVYVMPFGNQSTIYVDYNQDNVVENTYTASRPQVVRMIDANDNDMTGARIWSTDTLAMTYGELSGVPTASGSPALDLGYTVLPLAEQFVEQVLSIQKGVNIDTVVVGHPAEFTLTVKTYSLVLDDIHVSDYMPKGWDYVAQSTTISFSNGNPPIHPEPSISGTIPNGLTLLWDLGYTSDPNDSIKVHFSIVPTTQAAMGVTENCAGVQGSNGGNTFNPDDCNYITKVLGASIGDLIWNDQNGDGLKDPGEPGLPNVKVYLRNNLGQAIDSTVTAASGNYLFLNLMPGTYSVDVANNTLPSGYVSTTNNDPVTVTVAAGDEFLNADFGYRAGKANVGDLVWNDLNRNGIQDAGEPGLENVTVELHKSDGALAASTFSSSDGHYSFSNIVAGDYYLIFVAPSDYGFSQLDQGGDDSRDSDANQMTGRTATTTLSPGENDTSWDAGLYQLEARLLIKKYTNGDDADIPTGPSLPVGSVVTWTYLVSNPGDIALSNIDVNDSQSGVNPTLLSGDNGNGLLDPGETWTYQASGTAVAGQYQNLGTVSGSYNGQLVTDSDPSHYFGGEAGIRIKKSTNGDDADLPPGLNITPGAPVTWSYVITNTGNVAIGNIVVTDSETGITPTYLSGDNGNGLLDTGESWTYQASGVAKVGQYSNVGTVNGTDSYNRPVSDSDLSYYFGPNPAINVKKLTNGEDADVPMGPVIPVGQPVVWSYVVTNTGNVDLSDIAVTDDKGVTLQAVDTTPADGLNDGDVDKDNKLDVGETWTYTASGIAMEGQYSNTGTVTGNFNGQAVTDSDPSHYFGGIGGIEINKSTNGADADDPPGPRIIVGTPVTWIYQVRNIGNTPIRNVTVTDSRGVSVTPVDEVPADGFIDGDMNLDGFLDPGETWLYRASGTAQIGQYSNVGTASGVDNLTGLLVSDQDPSNYFGAAPGIKVKKLTNGDDANNPPGPTIVPGGAVTWQYIVTNDGNVALTNITVTDSDAGVTPMYHSGDVNNDHILDVNETWIYEANGVAVAGQYANTGTVTSRYNGTTLIFQDSDPSHYFSEGRYDFGDAPDPAYPTLLANNGARHIISQLYLGNLIDSEDDGQPSSDCSGDNLNGLNDEDGIQFPNLPFNQNSQNVVIVTSSGPGYLNAWIDFNRDGDWSDGGEHILIDYPVIAGTQNIPFQVPMIDPYAAPETFSMNARFRLSSQQGLTVFGSAPDGEVEDYQVAVYVPVELSSFTAQVGNGAVKLLWTTQSETDNLGFIIFRSETEDGQFQQISSQMIRGAGNSSIERTYEFIDSNVSPGKMYYYKLADISFAGFMHLHQAVGISIQATEYSLDQNYPNPFNPDTNIRFSLKEVGEVSLTIYNLQGQKVKTIISGKLDAGLHLVKWDGRNDDGISLSSGTYIYILRVNAFSKTLRMTLLK